MNAPASSGFVLRELGREDVGFDYAQAVLEINQHLSYDEIAGFCGYQNRASISQIVSGTIPHHPAGEALYVLYVELFHKKPPLRSAQNPVAAVRNVAQSKHLGPV